MIRSLNTASLGIRQFQSSLDVLANNLANLNTVGYKASRADFVESLNSVLRAPTPDTASGSGTSGVSLGNGVATAAEHSVADRQSQRLWKTDHSGTRKAFYLEKDVIVDGLRLGGVAPEFHGIEVLQIESELSTEK